MNYKSWCKSGPVKPSEIFDSKHWESFRETRKKHNENIHLETNKLVLRLDKLINIDQPGNPDLDKSIVEWTSDSLVKLCPFCAKSFSIARRRHHCRTCGAILCNSCSHYLEYKSACKLVKPTKLYPDRYDIIEERINDLQIEDKPKIRVCEDCDRLLIKRIQTIEDYYCQPPFYEFYETLRETMAEADELIVSQDSQVKDKIRDLKHKVAAMSSKLNKMIEKESGKQAYLLQSIRQSVAYWMRESIENKKNRVSDPHFRTLAIWALLLSLCRIACWLVGLINKERQHNTSQVRKRIGKQKVVLQVWFIRWLCLCVSVSVCLCNFSCLDGVKRADFLEVSNSQLLLASLRALAGAQVKRLSNIEQQEYNSFTGRQQLNQMRMRDSGKIIDSS